MLLLVVAGGLPFGEGVVAGLELIGKDVGHGPELDGPFRVQRLGRRAGASSAATDQGDLDRLIPGRMDPRDGAPRHGQGSACHCRSLQKLSSSGGVAHGWFLSLLQGGGCVEMIFAVPFRTMISGPTTRSHSCVVAVRGGRLIVTYVCSGGAEFPFYGEVR